jgi:hypothetical protein
MSGNALDVPTVDVSQNFLRLPPGVLFLNIHDDPVDQVVLERPFNHLVK